MEVLNLNGILIFYLSLRYYLFIMKFTFKTTKPTGRYRSFSNSHNSVKLKGKEVGTISDEEPYRVTMHVLKTARLNDGNENCDWMNITLRKDHESVQAAKEWLNESIADITTRYNLKPLD